MHALSQDIKTSNQQVQSPDSCLSPTKDLLQSIITNLPDAFIGVDKNGNIFEWNPQAETLFGWSAEEAIGKPLTHTIVPKRYRDAHQKGFERFIQTGKSHILGKALELNAVKKNDQEFPIELVISTVKPADNEYKLYAFIRDITLRKKQEAELEKRVTERTAELKLSSDRLKLALQTAHTGIWTWDAAKDSVTWDDNMYRLFGYPDSAQRPQITTYASVERWIHPDDRQMVKDSFNSALQSLPFNEIEYRITWPDGTMHYLLSRAQGEADREGHIIKVTGLALDITQQKRIEQERLAAIERAQKEQRKRAEEAEAYQQKQTEFINMICHEIRNPLQGIYGSLDALKTSLKTLSQFSDKTAADPTHQNSINANKLTQAQEAIGVIEYCADQQKVLVDDILDLSKLEAKKIELQPVVFDPKQVITKVVATYAPQARKKGLNLMVQLTEAIGCIKSDAHRFGQILSNLLSNALKFTDKGSITITAKLLPVANNSNEGKLECRVEDTGIGMTPDESQKLFMPFTQANSTISRTHGGTGLGLTISKKFVELMGGSIHVTSQKDQGTQFIFTIRCTLIPPQAQTIATALADTKLITLTSSDGQKNFSPTLVLRKTKQLILIVEDNLINQKLLRHILASGNYTHAVANNGKEAIDKYQQLSPGLIFMDVTMPVMDGLEATREIRMLEEKAGKPPVPIIGLSGNATKDQIAAAKFAGMTDYLTKPYLKADCYRMINQYISNSPTASKTKAHTQITVSTATTTDSAANIAFAADSKQATTSLANSPKTALHNPLTGMEKPALLEHAVNAGNIANLGGTFFNQPKNNGSPVILPPANPPAGKTHSTPFRRKSF